MLRTLLHNLLLRSLSWCCSPHRAQGIKQPETEAMRKIKGLKIIELFRWLCTGIWLSAEEGTWEVLGKFDKSQRWTNYHRCLSSCVSNSNCFPCGTGNFAIRAPVRMWWEDGRLVTHWRNWIDSQRSPKVDSFFACQRMVLTRSCWSCKGINMV